MPERKELVFFAGGSSVGLSGWAEYLSQFHHAENRRAVGEASVAYLFDREAPRLILERLGADTKILIVLRNPVDMAYSLWGHIRRQQNEQRSFEEAIRQEIDGVICDKDTMGSVSWAPDRWYLARARYAEQVGRYIELFPATTKVLIFEDIIPIFETAISEIYEWLGVDPCFRPDIRRRNVAGRYRSGPLFRALNRRLMIKELLKPVLPVGLRQKIKSKVNELNRLEEPLPPLDRHMRSRVWDAVADDVSELSDKLGRDLVGLWRPEMTGSR